MQVPKDINNMLNTKTPNTIQSVTFNPLRLRLRLPLRLPLPLPLPLPLRWVSDSPAGSNATNVSCVTTGGGPCNVPVAAVAGLQVCTMLDNIWFCSWS